MDANRKAWNQQQQVLQHTLLRPDEQQRALELCLSQHAMIHDASISQSGLWSFADEVWQDLTDYAVRRIPPSYEHSIAWVIWHIARIEDVTMNLLVAGSPQIVHQDRWLERMHSPIGHTGNALDAAQVADLSAALDLEALRAYRVAVGRRTREIVRQLRPEQLKQKVESSRLRQIMVEGAVLDAASAVVDYWSTRTIAGLLLMPATRHNFLHLNEALRLKQKNRQARKRAPARESISQ